jgi:hypothetical protein
VSDNPVAADIIEIVGRLTDELVQQFGVDSSNVPLP